MKLRQIRKDKKITQQKMSDDLHISRDHISNWENGRHLPRMYNIRKINDYLHTNLKIWDFGMPEEANQNS